MKRARDLRTMDQILYIVAVHNETHNVRVLLFSLSGSGSRSSGQRQWPMMTRKMKTKKMKKRKTKKRKNRKKKKN